MAVYSSGGELIHYGILGMKWGVRRYQNKDGTLTRAGKKRAKQLREAADKRNTDEKILDQYDKEVNKESAERVAAKEIKNLSDADLKAKIDRIKLENEYKDLAYPSIKLRKERKKNGKDLVSKIFKNATENIGTQAVAYYMGQGVNAIAKSLGAEGDVVNPKKGQKDK